MTTGGGRTPSATASPLAPVSMAVAVVVAVEVVAAVVAPVSALEEVAAVDDGAVLVGLATSRPAVAIAWIFSCSCLHLEGASGATMPLAAKGRMSIIVQRNIAMRTTRRCEEMRRNAKKCVWNKCKVNIPSASLADLTNFSKSVPLTRASCADINFLRFFFIDCCENGNWK